MTDVNWLVYDGQPGAGGTVIASGSGIDASVFGLVFTVIQRPVPVTPHARLWRRLLVWVL